MGKEENQVFSENAVAKPKAKVVLKNKKTKQKTVIEPVDTPDSNIVASTTKEQTVEGTKIIESEATLIEPTKRKAIEDKQGPSEVQAKRAKAITNTCKVTKKSKSGPSVVAEVGTTSARVSVFKDEKSEVALLTRRYDSLIAYKEGQPLESTSLNLAFISRALDEYVNFKNRWGPSLGVVYAITEAFPASAALPDGLKTWETIFIKDKSDAQLMDLIKTSYVNYDFREKGEEKSKAWGKDCNSHEALKRRITTACLPSTEQKYIMARFLVKLFDAYDSSCSNKRRRENLGEQITLLGCRMHPETATDQWKNLFNRKICLPESMVNAGYAKVDCITAADKVTTVDTDVEEIEPSGSVTLQQTQETISLQKELIDLERLQAGVRAELEQDVVRFEDLKQELLDVENSITSKKLFVADTELQLLELRERVEALEEFQKLVGADRNSSLKMKNLIKQVKKFKQAWINNKNVNPGPLLASFRQLFDISENIPLFFKKPASKEDGNDKKKNNKEKSANADNGIANPTNDNAPLDSSIANESMSQEEGDSIMADGGNEETSMDTSEIEEHDTVA